MSLFSCRLFHLYFTETLLKAQNLMITQSHLNFEDIPADPTCPCARAKQKARLTTDFTEGRKKVKRAKSKVKRTAD